MLTINPKGFTDDELKRFGLSRTTIWRARKRGWARVRYHERVAPPPSAENFDADAAYDCAWHCYATINAPAKNGWKEDLVQEAVGEMWDYSGRTTARPYQWTIARNTMERFMSTHCKNKWCPILLLAMPDKDDLIEFSEEEIVLDQLRKLAGEEVFAHALAGDENAIEEIRRKVWT